MPGGAIADLIIHVADVSIKILLLRARNLQEFGRPVWSQAESIPRHGYLDKTALWELGKREITRKYHLGFEVLIICDWICARDQRRGGSPPILVTVVVGACIIRGAELLIVGSEMCLSVWIRAGRL